MTNLDEIRERTIPTRDGFYHVVGAYRVMREADFDALTAEVERLRAERHLDNDALARVWDESRDKERAAVVAFLRENGSEPLLGVHGWEMRSLADEIERGEHRREETAP